MQEVFSILVALAALILGLIVIGWACGDFQPQQGTSAPKPTPGKKPGA